MNNGNPDFTELIGNMDSAFNDRLGTSGERRNDANENIGRETS